MPAKKPTGTKISQSELIDILSEKFDVTKKTVASVVTRLQDEIENQLYKGNDVQLSIGKFMRRDSKTRTAHNPQDPNQKIKVPAKKGVGFKVGARMKKFLNDAG